MRTSWSQPEAVGVAEVFLWLSTQDRPQHAITPLKLQKLLYYAQGWSLALRDRALFPESFKAWEDGPVIPQVWHSFPQGKQPIPTDLGRSDALPKEDVAFLASIWSDYKDKSAGELWRMVHDEETPWIEAYKPDAGGRCSNEIPTARIESRFKSRLKPLGNDELLSIVRRNKPPESWYREPSHLPVSD